VQKLAEYEKHAAVCRQIAAKTANESRKQQLLQMAEAWDKLAGERRVQLSEQPHDGHPQNVQVDGSKPSL
jgi:hypothetical protein